MPKGIYGKLGKSGAINDPSYKRVNNENLIKMEGLSEDINAVAQEDGTWAVTDDVTQALYEAEMTVIDEELNHYYGHVAAGETEAAERALLKYLISRAKVKEKYNKGTIVYVTESGSCYHSTAECSALSTATTITKINKSEGLENYSPCSICCN